MVNVHILQYNLSTSGMTLRGYQLGFLSCALYIQLQAKSC